MQPARGGRTHKLSKRRRAVCSAGRLTVTLGAMPHEELLSRGASQFTALKRILCRPIGSAFCIKRPSRPSVTQKQSEQSGFSWSIPSKEFPDLLSETRKFVRYTETDKHAVTLISQAKARRYAKCRSAWQVPRKRGRN